MLIGASRRARALARRLGRASPRPPREPALPRADARDARREQAGAGDIAVPPAIQALLAARLDRLEPDERGCSSARPRRRDLLRRRRRRALAPETREAVAAPFMSLVRKELIRPEPPKLPGTSLRFPPRPHPRRGLRAMPKEARAELHERIAGWLERRRRPGRREEIVGYHLEQAYRYRAELGVEDDSTDALAARAGDLSPPLGAGRSCAATGRRR